MEAVSRQLLLDFNLVYGQSSTNVYKQAAHLLQAESRSVRSSLNLTVLIYQSQTLTPKFSYFILQLNVHKNKM